MSFQQSIGLSRMSIEVSRDQELSILASSLLSSPGLKNAIPVQAADTSNFFPSCSTATERFSAFRNALFFIAKSLKCPDNDKYFSWVTCGESQILFPPSLSIDLTMSRKWPLLILSLRHLTVFNFTKIVCGILFYYSCSCLIILYPSGSRSGLIQKIGFSIFFESRTIGP